MLFSRSSSVMSSNYVSLHDDGLIIFYGASTLCTDEATNILLQRKAQLTVERSPWFKTRFIYYRHDYVLFTIRLLADQTMDLNERSPFLIKDKLTIIRIYEIITDSVQD